ncbi:MAG TPA: M20/M25/M40 family metallo-hydrolase [Terriglobales bacterium]|nr:M20/M25/M40 family metallo-hydrolase [Terriglobales bacterium]
MSQAARPPNADQLNDVQEEIARLASVSEVRSALQWFRDQEAEFARWQMELSRIPAPPFGEGARADWVSEQFRALGIKEVSKDRMENVVAFRKGRQESILSISAHIDTVFPENTPLNIRRQGNKLYGPGISDNAAGVTALLALAAAVENFNLPHELSLLFIGNVGEEGEGDLRGMRYIFGESQWKDSILTSLVIDGAGMDTIVAEALGSRRFEVIVRGPGGHSWSDFGAPNPIVVLGRAIHIFSQTRVSSSPKTTFNIGVIRGGTSVNSIPESASMRVDIRSSSPAEIDRLDLELRRAIDQAIQEEETRSAQKRDPLQHRSGLMAEMVPIGNRPGGELDPNSLIVRIARAVDAHLGNTAQIQRASTDANIPISLGREAIAIGAGGNGGGAHTLQEWFDPSGRAVGLARILLIALALAGAGR